MGKQMKGFYMSVSAKMLEELEKEKEVRRLESIQEVIRQILSDYLRHRNSTKEVTQ